jgi:hypothetical protein
MFPRERAQSELLQRDHKSMGSQDSWIKHGICNHHRGSQEILHYIEQGCIMPSNYYQEEIDH